MQVKYKGSEIARFTAPGDDPTKTLVVDSVYEVKSRNLAGTYTQVTLTEFPEMTFDDSHFQYIYEEVPADLDLISEDGDFFKALINFSFRLKQLVKSTLDKNELKRVQLEISYKKFYDVYRESSQLKIMNTASSIDMLKTSIEESKETWESLKHLSSILDRLLIAIDQKELMACSTNEVEEQ